MPASHIGRYVSRIGEFVLTPLLSSPLPLGMQEGIFFPFPPVKARPKAGRQLPGKQGDCSLGHSFYHYVNRASPVYFDWAFSSCPAGSLYTGDALLNNASPSILTPSFYQ
jgi:hypothetical protein